MGVKALGLECGLVGRSGAQAGVDPEHHGRGGLCALEQVLPILGVLFFKLGHPPGLVVVAPEFGVQGLLHQGVLLAQKTPQDRIQKGRLGLGVQLLFGGLHRLVDQGVGLIGARVARAHQGERRAQQLVDRDGGLFADQEAPNDAGSPPLPQCQKEQGLDTGLEPRVQPLEDLGAGVPALHLSQGARRGAQELPQRQGRQGGRA